MLTKAGKKDDEGEALGPPQR